MSRVFALTPNRSGVTSCRFTATDSTFNLQESQKGSVQAGSVHYKRGKAPHDLRGDVSFPRNRPSSSMTKGPLAAKAPSKSMDDSKTVTYKVADMVLTALIHACPLDVSSDCRVLPCCKPCTARL